MPRKKYTREQAAEWMRENWDELCGITMMAFMEELNAMDKEEVIARMLEKGKKYGEFDLEGNDWEGEFHEEVIDCPTYTAFILLQKNLCKKK